MGVTVKLWLPCGKSYIVYLTFLVAWMGTKGANATLIAATWGALGIAMMISPFPWRRILATATGGRALATACAATGVGTLLPLIVPGPAGLLLSAALFGVSFVIGPTSITAFGRKNLPEASWGRSIVLYTTVFAVGHAGPGRGGANRGRNEFAIVGPDGRRDRIALRSHHREPAASPSPMTSAGLGRVMNVMK
jgi:hypothetical protein